MTVGASNDDWVSAADRRAARTIIDLFPGVRAANPPSALGLWFDDLFDAECSWTRLLLSKRGQARTTLWTAAVSRATSEYGGKTGNVTSKNYGVSAR